MLMLAKSKILKGTIASALLLLTAYAQADVVRHEFRRFNFTFGTGEVLVPLNEVGANSISFSGSGSFTISYTAECSNFEPNIFSYVDIRIVVDGVNLPPTGNNSSDAFCTSDGVPGDGGWGMNAAWGRTGNLAAGVHTVQVFARTTAGGGSLGDSSLVIIK